MRILFIYLGIHNMVEYQFGVASISSVLKENGHKVNLIRINKEISCTKLVNLVKKIQPDIIAFSFVSNHWHYVKKYSKYLKNKFNLPIIAGGIHATTAAEEVINYPYIDYVCVGEGEYPMLEFVTAVENGEDCSNIKNIWAKKNGQVIKNELRNLIENLDTIPFGDRSLFYDIHKKERKDNKKIYIRELYLMAGRGCPYDCTYCCNHLLRKIYKNCGRYLRMRSVDNVLLEIDENLKKYDFESITFLDDTFTLFKDWIKEFAEKYPKISNKPFTCNARAENINDELLELLKKAGCMGVGIAIESGNEEFRAKILKRRMTNKQIIDAFNLVKKYNMDAGTFYLMGFPFETANMIDDTLSLHRTVKPSGGFPVSIFYPYPNTELYEICKKEGLLTEKRKDTFGGGFFGSGGYSTLNFNKEHLRTIKEKYWIFLDILYKENGFGYKWVKSHYSLPIYYAYHILSIFMGPAKAFMFMLSMKDLFIPSVYIS